MPSVLANCQEYLSKHAELEILNPFSSVIIIVRLLIREPWTRYRWKPDLPAEHEQPFMSQALNQA